MLLSPNNICTNWQKASQLQMEKKNQDCNCSRERVQRKRCWKGGMERGQKGSPGFSGEEWDKHTKTEEWWVLSKMNISLFVPLSPSLPIPACLPWLPRVQLSMKTATSGLLLYFSFSLLYSSLPPCGRRDQVGSQSLPQQCKRQTQGNWRQGSAEEGLREGLSILPWKEAEADCCCWKNMTLGVQLIIFSLLM